MGDKNYGVVDSLEALQRLADRVTEGGGPIAFDIETGYHGPDREKFSLHPETAIVVGISLTSSTDWARYVPLAHDVGDNLDNREAARILWPVLATGRGVAHNAPFERRHLSKWFRELLGDDPLFGAAVRECDGYFPLRSDTQVEAYVTAEHEHFGLKYLAEEMFGHKMTELHELFENLPVNKRRFLRFNILELTPRVVKYACEDSVWCLAIHERYYPKLVDNFIYRLDMAVLDCLCEMEEFGVCYDWSFMRRGKEAAHVFRDLFNAEIMTELTEMCGTQIGINLGSPAQIGDVLYNRLGFKTTVYTAGTKDLPPDQRKMSTGKIALAALAKRHPVVKKIQQWKEITKLKVSYLGDERKPGSGYEAKFNYAPDGRAHPNLLSAVVVTGRFSCSDPNYQQSPKKYHFDLEPAKRAHAEHAEAHGDKCKCDEYAPPPGTCFTFNFRDAIVAPPDHYILGFDLSQAELRAIAGEANETALLEAFAKGEDVHTLTASLMLGIPIDEVTPELRAIGKTMNFALLYGMGVKSLADRLAISVDEAQNLYDSYFEVYANIAEWTRKQVELGKRQGYVTSKFGRRLPIWEYRSDRKWIRERGDRACVNYPIQGAATGDYMRLAMVRCRKALRAAGLHDRVHMVMNVHDALEFYVHRSAQPIDVIRVLQPAIIIPVKGWPTMQADWHLAKTWGSPVEVVYTADDRLIVKGAKEIEIGPSIEEDDETGEEIVVLPEVDAEVLRRAIEPGTVVGPDDAPRVWNGERWNNTQTPGPFEGRRVIVTITEMPDEQAYERFLTMLDGLPGPNILTLRTPEGDLPVALPHGTALNASGTANVSLILGPVTITYDAADINPATVVDGLSL